jgi:hypothetical protein
LIQLNKIDQDTLEQMLIQCVGFDKDDTMDDFTCAVSLGGNDFQTEAVSTTQCTRYQGNLFKLRTDIPDFETEEELHTFMLQEIQKYEGELIQHRQDQTTQAIPGHRKYIP